MSDILDAIGDYTIHEEGEGGWYSMSEMRRLKGISDKTIRKRLRDLEDNGVPVQRKKVWMRDSEGKPHSVQVYRLKPEQSNAAET